MTNKILVGFALYASLVTSAFSEGIAIGDLTLMQPTIRATAPAAKVGAGYLIITNNGTEDEMLTGGATGFAGRLELHEMKMTNQVMKMRPLAGGLEIPAGATVKLAPGGNHIMFMKLHEQLKTGEQHTVTLSFEKAGEQEITFQVKSIADTMKMKHSH